MAPVFLLMLQGAYDLGNIVQMRTKLAEAAYAGGQYAVAFPTSTAGIAEAIKMVLPDGWDTVTKVDPPQFACSCWNGGVESPASCDSDPVCPIGVVERSVTVSLSRSYKMLMSTTDITISASHVARVQ